MTEKVGLIKNPLTIIAIFAGIAEVSGTIVLPLIETNNQSVYIWFLMLFPAFLVVIFFITLNFNYKVLYAPSDFREDDSFLALFRKAKPAEVESKKNEDVKELNEEDELLKGSDRGKIKVSNENNEQFESIITSSRLLATLAEELALRKIALDYNCIVDKGIRYNGKRFNYVFDGLMKTDTDVVGIEVKFMSERIHKLEMIEASLIKFQQIYEDMPVIQRNRFRFIFVIVVKGRTALIKNRINNINTLRSKFNFPLEIRIMDFDELQSSAI